MTPANDNFPPMHERAEGESVRDWIARRIRVQKPITEEENPTVRKRRSPIRQEHIEGRIGLDEMLTFDAVDRLFELAEQLPDPPANMRDLPPGRLVGAELSAHRALELEKVKDAAGHLWPAVEAAIKGRTMSEIGTSFGAANSVAPAIGREKLIDALRFIARGLQRQRAAEAANDWRIGLAA